MQSLQEKPAPVDNVVSNLVEIRQIMQKYNCNFNLCRRGKYRKENTFTESLRVNKKTGYLLKSVFNILCRHLPSYEIFITKVAERNKLTKQVQKFL